MAYYEDILSVSAHFAVKMARATGGYHLAMGSSRSGPSRSAVALTRSDAVAGQAQVCWVRCARQVVGDRARPTAQKSSSRVCRLGVSSSPSNASMLRCPRQGSVSQKPPQSGTMLYLQLAKLCKKRYESIFPKYKIRIFSCNTTNHTCTRMPNRIRQYGTWLCGI